MATTTAGRWHGFLGAALAAALLSSAVCAGAWSLARALGVSLLLPLRPGEVQLEVLPVAAVVASCVVAALLATLLFAVLSRLSHHPLELFLGLSVLVLISMLVSVVQLPDADARTRGVLVLLHVLAFLFITGPLVGLVRPPAAR